MIKLHPTRALAACVFLFHPAGGSVRQQNIRTLGNWLFLWKKSRAALAFCVRRAGSIESQRLWVFSARRVLIPLSVAPWAPLSAVTARRVSRRGRGQLACPDLEWRLCGPMIFPTRSSHWPIFWKTISPTSRIPQPFSPRLEAEDKTGFKMSVAGLKKQFYKASQVCKTFLAVSG